VFGSEAAAIAAIKSTGADAIQPGDTMVLAGIGPAIGMPETYQVTSALKHLPNGRRVALVTDGRFSGVSTGACIGHVSPEAWAGGPIGKVREGDVIRIVIDTRKLTGTLDVISVDAAGLAQRPVSEKLSMHPDLPDDTRLWAALQNASGGSWGGCVYDADRICALLARGAAR
jgi:dihydroxyacid dehydratase/phosphogluconate dehydratase